MASYFGEIIEPSTRALFEDCSDEESQLKTILTLVLKEKYRDSLPQFRTFVVAFGRLALAFVEAFVTDADHIVIGEVTATSGEGGSENLRKTAKSSSLVLQGETLICFAQSSLTADLAFDFAEALSPISSKSKEVVIITNESLSSYKTRTNEGAKGVNSVYSLKTGLFKTPLRPILNEANILSGIPAGVLSWCEIYDVPAVVYVSYSDSDALDSVTAEPLKGLLPCRNQTPDLKRHWMYGGSGTVIGALSNMYM